MTKTKTLLAALIASVPLLVHAQTANTPGGSASTGTPLDQTKTDPGKIAPPTTSSTPTTTNPSGTMSKGSSTMSKEGMSKTNKPGDKATTGNVKDDVPTSK